MKKYIIIILITFSTNCLIAQTDSLTFKKDIDNLSQKVSFLESEIKTIDIANSKILKEYRSLKNAQSALKKEYQKLNSSFELYKQNTETEINSLQQVINSNTANIKITADELGVKIDTTNQTTNRSINDLNKTVSQNKLYWIIAILAVALLILLVFVLLKKQIFKQKESLSVLDQNLAKTKKVLDEENVKLDIKLAETFNKQLEIIEAERKNTNEEVDHSLVLKVADRLISMDKNLSRMDQNTKGLKQLKRAVQNIKDNFASNGYEIIEMLGKTFNEGMKVSANFIPDEDLETGQQIITRIIKPQVNYKGVMIQSAQIEVSQG
jgi:hypothetical protein